MDYQQMEKEVRGKLASGIKFYPAFREVMLENDIRTDWDVHASRIGGGFARRRRANSKKGQEAVKTRFSPNACWKCKFAMRNSWPLNETIIFCATRRVALLSYFLLCL